VAETGRRGHNSLPEVEKRRTDAIDDHADDLTRILLVEDHVSFRQALAFMFEREPEFEVVGEAGSVAEVRELPAASLRGAEVAVVDLALPDGDGLELIEAFTSAQPQIMTLVLSASLEPGRFARAVEAGAAGVLEKDALPDEIGDALVRIAGGETVVAPQIEAQLREHPQLSRREAQVLKFLADGLSAPQIAVELNVAPSTVKTHLQRLYERLNTDGEAVGSVACPACRHAFEVDLSEIEDHGLGG
jgi:two-component system nitrate/nitrite response regulator NarL